MRSMMTAVMAALAAAFAFTMPAFAAAKWTCEGPEYVCGSGSRSVTTPSYSADDQERPRARAKNTRRATAAATSADREWDRPEASTASRKSRAVNRYEDDGGYTLSGKASYYWQPQRVASGGWFNPNAMTAAHKTLPFGTRVRVTNVNNGQSVVVTINDRGPYIAGRIIDLSSAAAGAINMKGSGVVPVRVAVLGRG